MRANTSSCAGRAGTLWHRPRVPAVFVDKLKRQTKAFKQRSNTTPQLGKHLVF